MKKFLAIILCAALVIGMIPAAFAGGTEKFTYNFTTAGQAVGNWSYTKGKSYYKMSTPFATEADGAYILPSVNCIGEDANGVALKISVPEGVNAEYRPVLTYAGIKSGGIGNVYLISCEDEKSQSWYSDSVNIYTESSSGSSSGLRKAIIAGNASSGDVKKIFAGINSYNADVPTEAYATDFSKTDTATGDKIALTSGDYWLIFGVEGADANAETYNGTDKSYYFRPVSLTFEKITPASVELLADTTEIGVAGTTTVSSVVKTADGTEISATVNYISSNDRIATVDAYGVVTGVAPGKATITATVDGTTISNSVEITVTKSYSYVFWAAARTEGTSLGDNDYLPMTSGGLGYNMVEGASEPWDYMATYGTSSNDCRKKELATRFSVKAASNEEIKEKTNAFIYKIKFAENGKYIPTLYYQTYANGGKVAVYLVPATWMEAQNRFEGTLDTGTEAHSVLGVAKNNNKLIGEANTYSTATAVSTSVVEHTTFAETEITEDEYYLVFSMNSAQGNPAANGSYYAYLSSLSFKKVGDLENIEKATVALAVDYGTGEPTITSYPRGKEITLTAPEISGKTFRHWVRGTADGGDWITNDATYSFTLATNTYLTAVYTETVSETDKIVEFWGGNGEYITEKKADANGKVAFPENPKLTGFEFLQWIIAKNTPVTADTVFENAVTRVVADFVDDADVTFEVDGTNYVYDTKVHKDADAEKAWYRDDVLVGYGEIYEHYVWDAVGSIEARDISGEKAPVVVLDDTVKEEKACMIEYDTAGKDVTEVGIVFGTSSATIDSCSSKATSQKKLSHGQFTAKPNKNGNASYARGYIIYNDTGVYRVTYTEPVALTSGN